MEVLARRPLKAITPQTTTSPATLQRALQAVRLAGYAWVDGEGTEGVAAMAVAGRVGDQPLGLSITGPSDRLARHRADYERALREVAAKVFDDVPPAEPPAPAPGSAAAPRNPPGRPRKSTSGAA
jgi:DNA-binding IclR family transcriptional regulator